MNLFIEAVLLGTFSHTEIPPYKKTSGSRLKYSYIRRDFYIKHNISLFENTNVYSYHYSFKHIGRLLPSLYNAAIGVYIGESSKFSKF